MPDCLFVRSFVLTIVLTFVRLQDLEHLAGLRGLSSLAMDGNPLSALPHSKDYAVFLLRSLTDLDGAVVSHQRRAQADDAFRNSSNHAEQRPNR